ncbi:MAG: sigma-70 family RNA polymerase sigma factor, partial [Deltaproteobacteria bacterium]|nr:sigma-70 family RNA polymerase sigma factor [Deltaproteobacteria bacterium]
GRDLRDLATAGPRSLSDQELLEFIRSGSEPHFSELYGRYFTRIYNFVYARMRNHADSEEAVQETFTAVFRSIGSYRGQSSLLSWIYGIAKNTVNNTLRRAKLQESRLQQMDARQVRNPESGMGCSPEDALSMSRYVSAIREQLESIGQWQAEIFVMRHLQDLSIKEISERTDRSSDSIRSSLYRVKRLLVDAAGVEATAGGR